MGRIRERDPPPCRVARAGNADPEFRLSHSRQASWIFGARHAATAEHLRCIPSKLEELPGSGYGRIEARERLVGEDFFLVSKDRNVPEIAKQRGVTLGPERTVRKAHHAIDYPDSRIVPIQGRRRIFRDRAITLL